MKVPYSWLKELVEISEPIDQVAEALSVGGFEVESIDNLSDRANGVVVGFVESVKQHPNADKLRICSVKTSSNELRQIVCGAPNVKANIHVCTALPGAYLPAINTKIKPSELRGVRSDGMICSLSELGITSDNTGIAILEELDIEIPNIGDKINKILNLEEQIIDLAITANRPDCMSINGIAREVSAITNKKLKFKPEIYDNKIELFTLDHFDSSSIAVDSCYSLTYLTIENNIIKLPKYLTERLINSGVKSINPIVDLTNYVMIETGQPFHAFDKDALTLITNKEVNETSFGVRKANKNELFKALDNKDYKLNEKITVITCHDIPIAIAGVIGGFDSAVTKNTKSIYIEASTFTANSVRNSARAIGVRTESSGRFEKGIYKELTINSLNKLLNYFKVIFDADNINTFSTKLIKTELNEVLLRRERINQILGPLNIDNVEKNDHNNNRKTIHSEKINFITDRIIENLLNLLDCEFSNNGNNWNVRIPPHRSLDLTREIDLIEEIARLVGYDMFESNLPYPIKPGGLTKFQKAERKLRKSLSSAGIQEVTTFSLVPPSESIKEPRIAISNPLLSETSHLRTNIWEEHLNICNRNIQYGKKGCWIYEIGTLYNEIEGKITEKKSLTGVISGSNRNEIWTTHGKYKNLNYYEARGLLNQAFLLMNIEVSDKKIIDNALLHPGRSAALYIEGKKVGFFGQLHPGLLENFEFSKDTFLFEIDFHSIIHASTRDNKYLKKYRSYPNVPFIERDIALIVDKQCSAAEIMTIIRKTGRPLLEKVDLIDRFEGDSLKLNEVSQAFRIRYRDPKKTLKEEDVNPIHQRIRQELQKKLNAELRS